MKLNAFRIQNFRRLKKVLVDLEEDISIFVGANNSGKTSATQVLDIFVNAAKDKLSIFDFSSDLWATFSDIGNRGLTEEFPELPTISVDLWFHVTGADLHRVSDLLPGLEWAGTEIGMRMQYQPKNTAELLQNFNVAKQKGENYQAQGGDQNDYQPWPGSLVHYLEKMISGEYHFAYYALDRAQFDAGYNEGADFESKYLRPELGKAILKSIIRVDRLNAQRHLADPNSGDRAEDLSKRLSRFYQKNLEKQEEDHEALKALSTSEKQLNTHLAKVFEDTLDRIKDLGYPGFNNPKLIIKSALNPAKVMTQDTKVHYALETDGDVTLPDSYNGLGFKNLIYMVVEILDVQNQWKEEDENRAALHLIFIEEPEAHLHAQLQQVFINRVLSLLAIDGDDADAYKSQVVVTTHSSHILYERGFKPIRYFRRDSVAGIGQSSSCLNLSQFYERETRHRDFLAKYLKLTHCDLFFADAAILVEGNVERLLLPLMVKKEAVELQSAYLSILEVNGAFAYQFKNLIEFLGIVTLVVTDIDSVTAPAARPAAQEPLGEQSAAAVVAGAPANEEEEEDIDEEEDDEEEAAAAGAAGAPAVKAGSKCLVGTDGAHTSNLTLKKWLPRMNTIADLLAATAANCTQAANADTRSVVRVTYQRTQEVTFGGNNLPVAGRTFEEAFALENAEWTQNAAQRNLKLKVQPAAVDIPDLARKLHKKISADSFDKTGFALNLLTKDDAHWTTPAYIREGLLWLREQLDLVPPPQPEPQPQPADQEAAPVAQAEGEGAAI